MPRTPTPRILMKRAQKNVTPHAVYRFFDDAGILLYVGCTSDPKKRCVCHRTQSTWATQIDRVSVKWFPGWLQAARAEAEAIMDERPKHNRISPLPANVGIGYVPHPRGDGSHCPKCGKPKLQRKDAYCLSCRQQYMKERKVALGWMPRPPPTTVCPRCKGPKEAGPAYCKKCKSQINRAYKKSKKEQKVALTKS